MINVIVNGALGKMGTNAVQAINNDSDLNLVGALDKDDNLSLEIEKLNANVVVDLTHPDYVYENVNSILTSGAHAVVGTTGLTDVQLKEIGKLASDRSLGVMVCPNFAIGAVLMMKFAAQAAKYMPNVEIIEYHHNQKADAPSGTAIKTAELIADESSSLNASLVNEQELLQGARGGKKANISIHSVRLPGVIASQDVIFGGLGQTLTLKHHTFS
ncbi:4-hydroxy-tetrahydrodipicolinate reductase, partial [Candidatus Marinamargulisbacteria bacterium SCGC AG-410-N11]